MTPAERKQTVRHLINIRECIEYLQERVMLSPPEYAPVVQKNLDLTRKKERALCKKIGYGDSINSSENSQKEIV